MERGYQQKGKEQGRDRTAQGMRRWKHHSAAPSREPMQRQTRISKVTEHKHRERNDVCLT